MKEVDIVNSWFLTPESLNKGQNHVLCFCSIYIWSRYNWSKSPNLQKYCFHQWSPDWDQVYLLYYIYYCTVLKWSFEVNGDKYGNFYSKHGLALINYLRSDFKTGKILSSSDSDYHRNAEYRLTPIIDPYYYEPWFSLIRTMRTTFVQINWKVRKSGPMEVV